MHKRRLIAGTLFGISASLFWVCFELIYRKAETLDVGICSAMAATIIAAFMIPTLANARDSYFLFKGDRQGIVITGLSVFLAILFFSIWQVCEHLISTQHASQSPLMNYHAKSAGYFLMFAFWAVLASPFLFITAIPFGAAAGWFYFKFIDKEIDAELG